MSEETLDRYFKEHPEGLSSPAEYLCFCLQNIGAVKFGEFSLAHHESDPNAPKSPIYIDLREVTRYPEMKELVVNLYLAQLRDLKFNLLAGVPHGVTPFVSSIADRLHMGMIIPREDKTHGAGSQTELVRRYDAGKQVVLIDDVITRGTSKFKTIKLIDEAELYLEDVVVLIDREEGGRQLLEKSRLKLHSAIKLSQMMDYYARMGLVSDENYQKVTNGITPS